MPSLGSILSIASSALRAQHEAMSVTAHNIANANTEGYARQIPVIAERAAVVLPNGVFGSGANVVDVRQIRDYHLDQAFRRESGNAMGHNLRSGLLGRVEGVFGQPGEGGLEKSLDAFFSAFSELATNPSSSAGRIAVREAGRQMANQFNGLAADIDLVRQDTEDRLMVSVRRVNELSEEIAGLNQQIIAQESGDSTAGDLRNARGRALDELGSLIPIQVTQRENGSIGVLTSGIGLVDGATANTLEIRNNAGVIGIAVDTQASTLTDLDGAIGGMLKVLNNDLPDYRGRLDALAEAIVTEVNVLHQTGRNPAGNTGIDFFNPAGTGSSSIALSADVLADTDAIAAGTEDINGAYQSGENDVALAMAALRGADDPTLGVSYGQYLGELVSDVGLAVRSSQAAVDAHSTLADQADIQRQSVTGVSVDEEMVRLIQFQAAYQAAARVITTADEMIQTLLNI